MARGDYGSPGPGKGGNTKRRLMSGWHRENRHSGLTGGGLTTVVLILWWHFRLLSGNRGSGLTTRLLTLRWYGATICSTRWA